jgi:hypothetical protein
MSRRVLLIEPDIDVLGAIASKLRGRGLEVAIADGVESAVGRARAQRPDFVLVSNALLAEPDLFEKLRNEGELLGLPLFVLVDGAEQRELSEGELPRDDAELIAKRLYALPSRTSAAVPEGGDFRGDLLQVSIPDLLQLLSMNKRSGTLSVTTASGLGEVRLAEGEIVDAVYRRLEGEKALFRLLGETEGSFSFASGTPQFLQRIEIPTRTLLMEGMRQIDETRHRRRHMADDGGALLAIAPPAADAPEVVQRVLEVLTVPRTLPELLDEVPLSDLDVLDAVERLVNAGFVRKIAAGAARVELADAERLTVLAALAKRAARPGFRGAPRVAIATSPQRLLTLMHALGRIADVVTPTDAVPPAPIPHVLGTLRLGESTELDVLGLPLVESYAPLWGLVLPGCAALARLDLAASTVLETACSVAGVPLLDLHALLRDGDEADPEQVAGLVRMLLERASGE